MSLCWTGRHASGKNLQANPALSKAIVGTEISTALDSLSKEQKQKCSSTPAGKMLFSVISAVAEFERDIIIERVRAGVAKAKANGIQFGRPRVGFDYQRAIDFRKGGSSIRSIAKELGVSRSTVQRLVSRTC